MVEDEKDKSAFDKILDADHTTEEGRDLIVRKALQLWKDAASKREKEAKEWEIDRAIYENDHWRGVSWAAERSRVTVPLSQSFAEATVAALTDNRPTLMAEPRSPQDTAFTENLEQAIYFVLDQNDWDIKFPKVVRTSVVLGPALVKIFWNPFISSGGQKGMIELNEVSAGAFYPDPEALEIDSARYVIHLQDLPYDWILENYRELADEVKAGEWDLLSHADTMAAGTWDGHIPVMSPAGTAWLMPFSKETTGRGMKGLGQRCRVMELFIRETADTIRRILIANGHVLENGRFGIPLTDGGVLPFTRYPFIMFPFRPMGWTFWPKGLISALRGLQLQLDKFESLIMDHMLWNSNAPWIVDREAGVDEKLDNAPNSVIRKSKEGQVRRENPAPMSNDAFNAAQRIIAEMEQVSGNVEILQGKNPRGVEAGTALQLLQEQASSRIRQTARYYEHALEKLGELIIDFIAAYWVEPRWVRLLGPDGKLVHQQMSGQLFRGHEFDVVVKAGSTLPFSREQRMKDAIELYKIGAFGQPGAAAAVAEVLKAGSYPGWEKIVERLEQEQQAAAQAAQEQAAAQAEAGEAEKRDAAEAKAREEPPPVATPAVLS